MKKYVAEAFGTFLLVFVGCGAAVFAGAAVGHLGVAFAFGLGLIMAAYIIGGISGCHINPAVTVGAWAAGRISKTQGIGYIIGQVTGAIIAAFAVLIIAQGQPDYTISMGLGQNGFGTGYNGGYNIISAKLGGGSEAVKMSGTSMSGPHVAGVMALMKQARPDLSALELKAMVLGTAKSISDKEDVNYPISQQGAGRVQVGKAVEAKVIASPATLSLGEQQIESRKMIRKKITLKNISSEEQVLTMNSATDERLTVSGPKTVTLAAG
ncbi:MAG: hypothetical protein COC17_08010, partial [Hyphomicrobiales bacterium]